MSKTQFTKATNLKPEITLVLDPRFPGGTSSAVARELYALANVARLRVVTILSNMFKGDDINPVLADALNDLGIVPVQDPDVVTSETIVVHNPSFLKFNTTLNTRFVCNRMIVVAHENFLRPNGSPGFDIEKCLAMLSENTFARKYLIAPVSGYNRSTVKRWRESTNTFWDLSDINWFNICDFELTGPSNSPADRRGRLSRAGFEKFPDSETMGILFPDHAEYCGILGADSLMLDPQVPAHWDLYKFRELPMDRFLKKIDFFVYFTHPNLQESFGRVIPEAIAAGKLVITDTQTAKTFGTAVICTTPDKVDNIIKGYVDVPDTYIAHVQTSQNSLQNFSSTSFSTSVLKFLNEPIEATIDIM